LIIAGHSITAAAAEVGVDRRTVERWRARAYSTRPEDQACVEFERMIWWGTLAAYECGQRIIPPGALIPSLFDLLADIAAETRVGRGPMGSKPSTLPD
jgi:hypothetical protein